MDIDPNIVFKTQAPDFATQIQKYQTQELANEGTRIANAKSLTQLEQDRITTEKRKRQEAYDQWRANNSPEINPATGLYDVNDYVSRAIKGGHGEFALRDVDELHKNQISNAASVQEMMVGHETAMGGMAATVSQYPPEQRAAAADALADQYAKQFGFDPRRMYGPEWYKVIDQRSQSTADNRTYNNAEGRDANSAVSRNLRDLINSQGGNIPKTVSAFDIINTPAYKTLYDQIPQEVRTGALKEVQKTGGDITRITGMITVIDEAFRNGVKPVEIVRKWIDSALNDDERAQRAQIVAELKSMGIESSETGSIAGARDALVRKLEDLQQQRAGATGVAGARTVEGALTAQPAPAKVAPQVSGGVSYKLPNGKVVDLTPEQVKKYGSMPGLTPVNKPQPSVQPVAPPKPVVPTQPNRPAIDLAGPLPYGD